MFLSGVARWLLQGGIIMVWGMFPGAFIVFTPVAGWLPESELFGMAIGAAVIGVSVAFWRGVRATNVGRRWIDAVLSAADF